MKDSDASFRLFVEDTQTRLVNFAEFLVTDRGRAEDLVQDALVKAYSRWPRIRRHAPEAYVRRCIVNGRNDWWRRRSSREHVSDRLASTEAAGTTDPQHEVDERLRIFSALRRLTVRERTVIVLRYYIGLSEADIATELGLAAGTVKSTASRAVGKLRDDPLLKEGADHEIC